MRDNSEQECSSRRSGVRKKRFFYSALSACFLALCFPAAAQQSGKNARIGWLSSASSAQEFPERQVLAALRSSGWAGKRGLVIEFRHAAGNAERLAQMAAELTALKVDAIVTFSAGVAVARRATTTIPIVMQTSQDPVRAGLVASLARPGGNLTGVTFLTDELSGKRLELLKEALPRLSRVAIVWEPAHVDNEWKGMQGAAAALGLRLQSLEVARPAGADEVHRTLQAAREAEAVVLAPGGFTIANRKQLIEAASKRRLPVLSAWKIFAEDGALLSYGPDIRTSAERLVALLGKVLNGAPPAELPVEQPTRFELAINLRTAKQIDVKMSPQLLARADSVIR